MQSRRVHLCPRSLDVRARRRSGRRIGARRARWRSPSPAVKPARPRLADVLIGPEGGWDPAEFAAGLPLVGLGTAYSSGRDRGADAAAALLASLRWQGNHPAWSMFAKIEQIDHPEGVGAVNRRDDTRRPTPSGSASGCGQFASRKTCRCRTSSRRRGRSSRPRCSEPTSGASGRSPCPRLQRLAKFYNVPVDQLLPGDVARGRRRGHRSRRRRRGQPTVSRDDDERIRIDLAAPRHDPKPGAGTAAPVSPADPDAAPGLQRTVLTIRREDLRAIACMFELTARDRSGAVSTTWVCACLVVPASGLECPGRSAASASTFTSRSALTAATTAPSPPGPTVPS